MKKLKFTDDLSKKVLSGEKTATWRLFDDKGLEAGDGLLLVNSETGEDFARAKIQELYKKTLGEIVEEDYKGAGPPKLQEEMLKEMRTYYGPEVNFDTEVKILRFVLV